MRMISAIGPDPHLFNALPPRVPVQSTQLGKKSEVWDRSFTQDRNVLLNVLAEKVNHCAMPIFGEELEQHVVMAKLCNMVVVKDGTKGINSVRKADSIKWDDLFHEKRACLTGLDHFSVGEVVRGR